MRTPRAWCLGGALLALGALPACRRKPQPPVVLPLADRIVRTGPMVDGRLEPRVADLGGGHHLILSGAYLATDPDTDSSGSAEVYVEAGDAFVEVGVPQVPRISQALVALPGGDALMAGGWARGEVLDSVERYRAGEARFERLPGRLTAPRSGGGLLAFPDGKVLLWGGRGRDLKPLDGLEWVDASTGAGQSAGKLAHPRPAGAGATLLTDGSVLFTGGEKGDGQLLASVERFEPRTGRCAALAPLGMARAHHATVPLPDGRVLLIGGEIRDAKTGRPGVTGQVEVFDPARGTLQPLGSLRVPRSRFAWAWLPSGRILLAGGLGGPGEPATLVQTERLDPATGQSEPGPSLAHGRSGDAALRRRDGRVLILGSGLEVVERYE